MPRAFFHDDAFFEPGAFFETLSEAVPVIIDLGEPGNVLHALPYRIYAGGVVDTDVLYGFLPPADVTAEFQPLFFIVTRAGIYRCYGKEVPRQAVQDLCIEAKATLKGISDSSVEGNPAGTNLFGSVALTTRPFMTVTVDNSDGSWTLLDEEELLMGCPAGLFWDVGHRVVIPELVGVVTGVDIDADAAITFGHAARLTRAPILTD